MQPVLVQMSTRVWTMQAVHLACALARNNGAEVVLLRLIPVTHLSYLGTPYGYREATHQEMDDIREYAATAEDYDVEFTMRFMQCVTSLEAVTDAAEQLDAGVVFAHVPASRFPYWQKIQIWMLERRLSPQHRQLFTLAKTDRAAGQMPYIVTTPQENKVRFNSGS